MALSDNTPSSTAVLRSSIALASSHRDNEVYATARSKVAALRALAKSLQGFIGVSDSACHIGAGIILSTLEVGIIVRSFILTALTRPLGTTKLDDVKSLAMVCLWRCETRQNIWSR